MLLTSTEFWKIFWQIKKYGSLYCEIVSPRNDKDTTFMIPQQYGCLSKGWTMTTPTDILIRKGDVSQGPTTEQRIEGNSTLLRGAESVFLKHDGPSREPNTKWSASPEMIYAQATQIDLAGLFICWCIYVSVTIIVQEKGPTSLTGGEMGIWEELERKREAGSDIIWF